ncbi:hypothetical protein HPB47_003942 [Ixodes persulcatus]|uniref:Uncharacterized protein n=1 Tax=Ixodes persulcatus TaxID=34615 RepID=A0AC60PI20_IXOPE|nr:hypothetical protein HPB47_003942 [Ixodes persulcatus]
MSTVTRRRHRRERVFAQYAVVMMGRQRVFRDRLNPLEGFDEDELQERFRFGRAGIVFLADTLRRTWSGRRLAAAPSLQSSRSLSAWDYIPVHVSTASRTVRRVTLALSRRARDFVGTIGQLKRRFHCLHAELRMQQRDAVTSLSPAVSCTTWPRHAPAACQGLSSPKRFPSSPWQRVVMKAMRLGTAVKPPGTNVSCAAHSLEPAAPPLVTTGKENTLCKVGSVLADRLEDGFDEGRQDMGSSVALLPQHARRPAVAELPSSPTETSRRWDCVPSRELIVHLEGGRTASVEWVAWREEAEVSADEEKLRGREEKPLGPTRQSNAERQHDKNRQEDSAAIKALRVENEKLRKKILEQDNIIKEINEKLAALVRNKEEQASPEQAAKTNETMIEEDPEIEVGPRTDRAAEPAPKRRALERLRERKTLDRHGERLDKVEERLTSLEQNVAQIEKNDLVVWHWNCNGYARKKAVLHQHLKTVDRKPDVIMLQESNATETPKLTGYRAFNKPSDALRAAQREGQGTGLSLITDPAYPTRTGSSVTRDTTPDLTFFRGIGRTGAVGWRNTGQDLGSDHFIVEATIPITRPGSHTERRKHRITNWDAFREALGSWQSEITDIDQWTDRVIRTMEATTKEVEAEEHIERVDSKLAHLLEAKQSIKARWSGQRTNRKLRRKVAELNRRIEAHCKLARIMHEAMSRAGEAEVKKRLNERYLPSTPSIVHPEYTGNDNAILDRDIEQWEVRAAMQRLNGRWQQYLEDSGLYPDSIIGFRNKLGTQDAMIQLKHKIVDVPLSTRDNKAILGLDLQSAFNKVAHSSILAQVTKLDMGRRSYNYIRDFLTGSTTRLCAGDVELDEKELGSVGTPQGSVISPLLFNLVMIGVAQRLQEVKDVRHTIYADDITLWVSKGSDGHIEERLQEAVLEIEDHLEGSGLRVGRRRKDAPIMVERPNITIRTRGGLKIPEVDRIRVLGMLFERNRVNGVTITKLNNKVMSATKLLRRISNHKAGMKEESMIRLVQSIAISHIAYVAAFHKWTLAVRNKIDALIRKVYKIALGLPAT